MLLVLRHGPSLWNSQPSRCQGQLDVPLSEPGRELVRHLAPTLPWPDLVWSSPLRRARETAEIILSVLAAGPAGRGVAPEIRTDPRLVEAHCGRWQGQLHEEIRRRWPDQWRSLQAGARHFAFPGGESLEQVATRFERAIEEIEGHCAHQRALVVSHGGPIRLYLARRGLIDATSPGAPPRNLEGFILDHDRITLFLRGEGDQ